MYLYQIDNKLIVSETKRPERGIYKIGHELYHALSEWQKNLIPVKEGEEFDFKEFVGYDFSNNNEEGNAKIKEALKNGIKLPENSVMFIAPNTINGESKPTHAYLNNQPKKEESNEAIELLVKFAEAHEQWEADIINEDKLWWPNRAKDVLSGKIYEDFLKIQSMRNEALKKFKQQ